MNREPVSIRVVLDEWFAEQGRDTKSASAELQLAEAVPGNLDEEPNVTTVRGSAPTCDGTEVACREAS